MNARFITPQIHAYIDYPVAVALIGLPFAFGLGATNPLALWLSVVAGVAAFVLTLLTDHQFGVIRVLPYWFHLTVDRIVGITFAVAPILLGFKGIDAAYYWANAVAVLAVTFLLNKAETPVAATVRA
jgi:hypothetical protein